MSGLISNLSEASRLAGFLIWDHLIKVIISFLEEWDYEFAIEAFFRTIFNGEVLSEDWVEEEEE